MSQKCRTGWMDLASRGRRLDGKKRDGKQANMRTEEELVSRPWRRRMDGWMDGGRKEERAVGRGCRGEIDEDRMGRLVEVCKVM